MQPFIIHLSNGQHIKIDGDELDKVIDAIKKGMPVMTRQSIFNPSYFVCIVEDKDRIKALLEYNERNKNEIDAGAREPGKFVPLSDIFTNLREAEPSRITQPMEVIRKPYSDD